MTSPLGRATNEGLTRAPIPGSGVYHSTITGLSQGISETDKLFVYARVADCAVPRQIVLRAKVGGQWTTAYWGEPVWGVTAESINMGAIPASGTWQRLDILLRDLAGSGDPAVSDLGDTSSIATVSVRQTVS